MNELICPDCKIIHTSGKLRCTECGKKLIEASETEVKEFEKRMKRASDVAFTDRDKHIKIRPFDIAVAAVIVLLGVVITLIKGLIPVLIVDILLALTALMPDVMSRRPIRMLMREFNGFATVQRVITIIIAAIFNGIFLFSIF